MSRRSRPAAARAVEEAFRLYGDECGLTPHLVNLLILLLGELSYDQMADQRRVNRQTIKEQASQIFHALNAASRSDLQKAAAALIRRAAAGASVDDILARLRERFE